MRSSTASSDASKLAVLALALICCGRRADPPPSPGSGSAVTGQRPPPANGCTEVVAHELPRGFCWDFAPRFIDANLVAVLGSRCEGPRALPAIVVYDLRETYDPHRAHPLYSFIVEATDGAVVDNTKRLMLVGPKLGLATLDLTTGCLRSAAPLDIQHVAFDTARERFFVVANEQLLRLDGSSLTPHVLVAQLPEIQRLAYAPAIDRVVARSGGELWTYDASEPGVGTRVPLPRPHLGLDRAVRVAEASIHGGPWVRPGHAEAIVQVKASDASPWQLALIDLASGDELRVTSLPHQPYERGNWHPDGTLFVIDLWETSDVRVAWQVATGLVRIKPRNGIVLGPGDRFVRMDSGYLVAGSTQRWDVMYHDWSVAMPR